MITPLPPPPESYRRSHKLMGPVLHRFHVSCRDFTELSLQAMDRRLTFREKLRLRFHFLACSLCRDFGKQMRSLPALVRAAFASQPHREADPEFLESTRGKLEDIARGSDR